MIRRLVFVCVGKLKESYYREACREYEKRIGLYACAEITELQEYTADNEAEIAAALARDRAEIENKIPKSAYVIAMCVEGEKLSSEELSGRLERLALNGVSKIYVIIGGSNGLDERIKAKADLCLSMSDMTFPHHLARVMVLEQFYRALSISANAKYHK